jgi:hypothetical protein
MFLENKYTKFYNSIVENALRGNRIKLKPADDSYIYYETHHIIPKCIGGGNELENLVNLTAREHFLVHWLLTKMISDKKKKHKLIEAFGAMSLTKEGFRVLSSKQFEISRKYQGIASYHRNKGIPKSVEHKKKISESNRGYNKNKTFDEIHGTEKAKTIRIKMAESAKVRPSRNQETIEKTALSNTGKKRSKEFIESCKIRNKGSYNPTYGKIWINDKIQTNKLINKNELEIYVENGWIKGRIMPRKEQS